MDAEYGPWKLMSEYPKLGDLIQVEGGFLCKDKKWRAEGIVTAVEKSAKVIVMHPEPDPGCHWCVFAERWRNRKPPEFNVKIKERKTVDA